MGDCTEQCWAMPTCTSCGKVKAPRGRSIPLPAAGGYCTWWCTGYDQEPRAGHYWYGEEVDPRFAGTPKKGEGR